MDPFRIIELDNGLRLELHDQSNRYFGDYHRLKIEVRCTIPLDKKFFGGDENHPDLLLARNKFGESLCFERSLERMGVAGADVAPVREELVASFMKSSASYLEHPEFVAKFVARKLQARVGALPGL